MKAKYYTQSHDWLLEEDDAITIGITDHAQKLLGDVVFVGLPEVGLTFVAGEELVVIESVKAAGGINTLVAGEVIAVNTNLEEFPEELNEDPMGSAWIVKIRSHDELPSQELMTEEEYLSSIAD